MVEKLTKMVLLEILLFLYKIVSNYKLGIFVEIGESSRKIVDCWSGGTLYTIGGHIVRIRLLIVSMNIVNFMSLNHDSYCTSCFICVDLCGIVENYKKLEHFVRNTINCLILV